MTITNLLTEQRILCAADVSSKKRVLEVLSQLIADSQESVTQGEIFESFLSRERLGSTGLGYGVALPHGRLPNVTEASGAFVQLGQGIDFDAIDQQPVDLLFALVVPQEATEVHLQILASLAERFQDPEFRQKLRVAKSPAELMALFGQAGPDDSAHHRASGAN